jgi:hypothetical protein
MAAVDLCTFNHGLGIRIRILSLAGAREKIIYIYTREYNPLLTLSTINVRKKHRDKN